MHIFHNSKFTFASYKRFAGLLGPVDLSDPPFGPTAMPQQILVCTSFFSL